MKITNNRSLKQIGILALATLLSSAGEAYAKGAVSTTIAHAQRNAETQIRHLLEPLLDKYCRDECKLMSVSATVDVATPEDVAPGFDEVDPRSASALAPSSGKVKILMDEKIGPISRTKLMDIIQQYLETLDFPVKVDTQSVRFPQPVGSAGKVAELRERVTRQFRSTIEDLFRQFCPDQCLLADYNLQTEVVNAEEAQYGSTGEFAEDGGVAIRIRNISATLLVDETLSPEERANVLEMAKLKTNFFKNVTFSSRSMKFPRPSYIPGEGFEGDLTAGAVGRGGRGIASRKSTETNSNIGTNSANKNEVSNDSKTQQTANSNTTEKSIENKNSNDKNSTQNIENNQKQERFERFEKIERVENGDAVQKELEKFKHYGLMFGCSILSLLIFIAVASFKKNFGNSVEKIVHNVVGDPSSGGASTVSMPEPKNAHATNEERREVVAKRYEIERLIEELMNIFAQNPRVAKQVFTRVLTEEGVEVTAQYLQIFGESVVMDMLRDPSLQADLSELMEYYAKNPSEIEDDEKLDLLRKLHNRTVAGKLFVMGARSSNIFEFLAEMDGTQILELIRNESLTVKSIVLTQTDPQKRMIIYNQLDEDTRMRLMSELSRIDYLPRDYIFNVANALKRKRRDNPKLNTEALPGSDVLLTFLERTNSSTQKTVIQNLEMSNPEGARTLKGKMVSLDTLRFLRDGQLLEVVLSLKHDELLQFLKGCPENVRTAVFSKAPKDLVAELEEELTAVELLSREAYMGIERKILNRMKVMANEGLINLIETNERMLNEGAQNPTAPVVEAGPAGQAADSTVKKVAGW